MKMRSRIRKTAGAAVDLLLPPRCPLCDGPAAPGEGGVCPACRKKPVRVEEPFCMRCGKPLGAFRAEAQSMGRGKLPGAAAGEYCGDCAEKKHLYSCGRALYEYGSVAPAIYRFKYGGRREYASFFGERMAEELGAFIRLVRPDGLVPVPLSRRRMQSRGYNQAQLLAERIGDLMQVPVYPDVVARVRDTVPQKKLNPKQRQNNLKKAFKIVRDDVKLSTIIIVDDIYTTGSTIDAVAEVFLQTGAQRVCYVALAVGNGM